MDGHRIGASCGTRYDCLRCSYLRQELVLKYGSERFLFRMQLYLSTSYRVHHRRYKSEGNPLKGLPEGSRIRRSE